jgi:hypothetical protein
VFLGEPKVGNATSIAPQNPELFWHLGLRLP